MNETSRITLAINAKELDEVSSGLARMNIMQHGLFMSLNLTRGLANSECPDEMPYNATINQGLHSFTKTKSILIERKIILEIKTCDLYIYMSRAIGKCVFGVNFVILGFSASCKVQFITNRHVFI